MARVMEKLEAIKKIIINPFISTSIFIVTCLLVLGMSVLTLNTFTIKADGEVTVVKTYDTNLTKVLKNNGINWDIKDEINLTNPDKGLFNVTIRRGFLVNLFVDGEMMSTNVYEGTVGDILKQFNITLKAADKINFKTEDLLSSNMNIKINRIAFKTVVDEIKLPYKTVLVPLSYSFTKKMKNSSKAGVLGVKKITKQLKIVDGLVAETKVVKEEITKKPTNAIVYSDASNLLNTGKGKPEKFKKVYTVRASAYTGSECKGRNTATGKKPRVGYVAVDPKLIPLGSKLYIETVDGSYVYGYAEAQDTGGAIKGKVIDVFLPSIADCLQFGRRTMNVYVLS